MRVVLPWGIQTVSLELPASWDPVPILPAYRSTCYPHRRGIQDSLENPIGSGRLRHEVSGSSSALVVIPDWSRPCTASVAILRAVLNEILEAGVRENEVTVAVATGAHRRPAGDTYIDEVKQVAGASPVLIHDCMDGSLKKMGETARGTKIALSKLVSEHDFVVLTGLVFPHYFAGFSGGVKSLLPGLAGIESIMANHRLSLSNDTAGKLAAGVERAALSGNPVAEDIAEVGLIANPDFLVNAVVAADGEILACFAGHYMEAHRRACHYAYGAFCAGANGKADLALASTGGHPFDCNLLQAHKSLINAVDFADEGSPVILVARCDEGVGSESFEKWLAFETAEDIWRRATEKYSMSAQTAMSMKDICSRFDVTIVSDMPQDRLRRLGLSGVPVLDEAIEMARDKHKWIKVAVLPEAYVTISREVECRI
jgi:nickel-dependent lactate racemase